MKSQEVIKTLTPPAYVSRADGDLVTVKAVDAGDIAKVKALGFKPDPQAANSFSATVSGDTEKGALFGKLRDEGICFSWGKEWNPAEVFQWLKQQGYVTGKFRSISWGAPDKWSLRDEE